MLILDSLLSKAAVVLGFGSCRIFIEGLNDETTNWCYNLLLKDNTTNTFQCDISLRYIHIPTKDTSKTDQNKWFQCFPDQLNVMFIKVKWRKVLQITTNLKVQVQLQIWRIKSYWVKIRIVSRSNQDDFMKAQRRVFQEEFKNCNNPVEIYFCYIPLE